MTGDSTLPRFTTRAELEAWARQTVDAARSLDELLEVARAHYRVTLAHVDLKD